MSKIVYVAMEHQSYSSLGHESKVAITMAEAGHEVALVTDNAPKWSPESPQPKNLEVLVAPVNDAKRAAAIARGLGGDFDAAFASSVSGAPILAEWKKRNPSAPAVVGERVVAQALDVPLWRLDFGPQGPWFELWRPWFEGLMAMDRVVTNTAQTQDDLMSAARLYGVVDVPPTSLVYYGIDTDASDAAVARDLRPPEGVGGAPASWCVSASRLVPYKGVDLGLAALSVLPENVRPAFAVIGGGEDLERLVHFATLAGVSAAFAGPVSDEEKFEIVKGAKLGMFLAFNRHIPAQFPLECAYSGRACVVHDMPINRERFGGAGEMVRFVNAFRTEQVAHAVLDLIEREPSVEAVEKVRGWIRGERSFRSHARGVLEVLGVG